MRPEAGFWKPGMTSARVCTADDIHDPINWTGVVSAGPPATNFWWKDGEIYDAELDGLSDYDLEEASYQQIEHDHCVVCGAPALGLCEDCQ